MKRLGIIVATALTAVVSLAGPAVATTNAGGDGDLPDGVERDGNTMVKIYGSWKDYDKIDQGITYVGVRCEVTSTSNMRVSHPDFDTVFFMTVKNTDCLDKQIEDE